MAMVRRLVISQGGQVSVPAAVRKRWGVRTVLAEDRGEELVLRPAPDDPVAAIRGVFAKQLQGGPTTDQLRKAARAEDDEAARRGSTR